MAEVICTHCLVPTLEYPVLESNHERACRHFEGPELSGILHATLFNTITLSDDGLNSKYC